MKARKSKSLDCKVCGEEVHNVGEDTVAVTCWKCVNKMMSGELNICKDEDTDPIDPDQREEF
jgi:hypothetical protein